MPQMLIFGDSIAYGYWDFTGGWVQRLREFLDRKFWDNLDNCYTIYNLGVPGDSSREILTRFETEIKSRSENPPIIIFSFGTNDSWTTIATKQNNVPLDKFQSHVNQIINITQKYSNNILFIGPLPVEDEKLNPIPFSPNESYQNVDMEKYNLILKTECQKNEIPFIDMYNIWIKLDYKKWLIDGVHPNPEGHQKIFETVRNYLEENKII